MAARHGVAIPPTALAQWQLLAIPLFSPWQLLEQLRRTCSMPRDLRLSNFRRTVTHLSQRSCASVCSLYGPSCSRAQKQHFSRACSAYPPMVRLGTRLRILLGRVICLLLASRIPGARSHVHDEQQQVSWTDSPKVFPYIYFSGFEALSRVATSRHSQETIAGPKHIPLKS